MRNSVIVAAFLLMSCGGGGSNPPPAVVIPTTPPVPSLGWVAQFSAMPINISGNGFWFDFPQDCPVNPALGYKECKAGYMVKGWSGAITEGKTFSMRYRIEGSDGVVFRYDTNPNNTCGPGYPGITGFYIVSATDANNGRFYLQNQYASELKLESKTFSVVVSPQYWTGVYGTVNAQAWSATLANVGGVGFVFGGGCFAAHGVNVSGGSAKFTLDEFVVQ